MSANKKVDFKTPGARKIETSSNLQRLEKDLQDRQSELKLEPGMERKFGYMAERSGDSRTKATIKRISNVIKNHSPQDLNQSERKKWEETGRLLESWLVKNMMPLSRLHIKRSDPEFHRIANQLARCENSREYSIRAERWVNIMRQLHPQDPYMSSLERIRPR